MNMFKKSARSEAKGVNPPWFKSPAAYWAFRIAPTLFIIGFIFWFFFLHPYITTDDARVAATLVRLAPQGKGGRVVALAVTEGSVVKRDAVVAELDHSTAAAQLLRTAARYRYTQSERSRAQTLYKQGNLAARDMERAVSEAGVAEAEARLAQIDVDNTYLKSPVDGIVVQKPAEIGNIAEPGQTVVSIVDIDNAWVAANIEETAVRLVKPGQSVKISIDEGGTLEGEVLEVRAAAASSFSLIPSDNAAGNFIKLVQRIPIKIALKPHPGKQLRLGQSVYVKIRIH